jgi:4-hydroxybenzoate polyprenyltransferase
MTARWIDYVRLVRLNRPIGILLLLWPTLWAVWIASGGKPAPAMLATFIAGTILMRSAGCAMNDYADRSFDRHVRRTRDRPVASGVIAPWQALVIAGVLAAVALILILHLNLLTWALACVAAAVAASYPFTKRFFALPQAYLGVAFGFGIPMAFAAINNRVPRVAVVLLAANIFWAIAYDTEYAMVDREDDLKIGIQTAAITFGRFDVAAIMGCYGATIALLAGAGAMAGRGPVFYGGLALAAAIAFYHYRLIRQRIPVRCFQAFLHNNWFGASVFAGLALDYLVRIPAS